jgi:lipopolysaccharide transport system permease protein
LLATKTPILSNINAIKETRITPKKGLFELNLKELWHYKDLLYLFVKRDIITVYKQTVLGPLWYLIQPLFTSVIFTLIFNNIAGISTAGVSSFLYNLAGIIIWNYFADCINGTSDTFKKNEAIFGKVYFPRVIVPISIMVSSLVKFGIQFLIFISFYFYFLLNDQAGQISWQIVYFPLIVIIMGVSGLSLGMVISSLTTKYRDLIFLVQFGVQLLMYLSAVMYPIALAKERLPSMLANLVSYNPLAIVIDNFRKIVFFNSLDFSFASFIYPFSFAFIMLFFGLFLFNRTEKSFIDTI